MKKYNVLWLMSDQHNANCMGNTGNTIVRTPFLDEIANDGINFTNGFANNPICSPSRICFMNGQHVHTHGFYGNQNTDVQKENPIFLPSVFRKYGYQTAMYGKAHLVRKWCEDGFEDFAFTDMIDAWSGDPHSCHYFKYLDDLGLADFYEEGTPKAGQGYTLDGTAPAQLPFEHSIEKFTADKALNFLKTRDEDRPFFLNVSFQRPHSPIAPSPEHFNMYSPDEIELPESIYDLYENKFASKPQFMQDHIAKMGEYPLVTKSERELRQVIASYYALITVIDEQIGRIIDKLKEMGEYENTIIFYTADHGDFAGEHGLFHKNFGIYDSIQKIPFIFKYPNCKKGMVSTEFVESIDWYPTICELCGIPVSDKVEGASLVDIMEHNGKGKDEIFCDWAWGKAKTLAVRTHDKRLVYHAGVKDGELYDHKVDKDETNNLYHNNDYLADRVELTDKVLGFAVNHMCETDIEFDMDMIEKTKFDPVILVQKKKIYWSDLEHTYKTLKPWPPKKEV